MYSSNRFKKVSKDKSEKDKTRQGLIPRLVKEPIKEYVSLDF